LLTLLPLLPLLALLPLLTLLTLLTLLPLLTLLLALLLALVLALPALLLTLLLAGRVRLVLPLLPLDRRYPGLGQLSELLRPGHPLLRILDQLLRLGGLLRGPRLSLLLELLPQALQRLVQRFGPLCQLGLLLRTLRRQRALLLHRLRQRLLLASQLLRLLGQGVHLLLRGRPAQELEALLHPLAQLILVLRELLQRLLHLLRVEVLERLPELVQPLAQLRGQHLVVELSQLVEAFLELRVLEPGGAHGPVQRVQPLPHLLDLADHRLLALQQLSGGLGLAILHALPGAVRG